MENKESKYEFIHKLIEIASNSQNFHHIDGTTQTSSNGLDATGKHGEIKTTRGAHSRNVSQIAKSLIDGIILGNESLSKDQAKTLTESAELASLIGLCHDIGHCPYGHDGEFAINSFLNEQGKVETATRVRDKFYGDYDRQQKIQNTITGRFETENNYVFDHGEQSAEAFINMCEANGIDTNEPIVKETIQGILFHSRPAFKTDSLACQAVQIADSMAFYQDDSKQMVAFLKISDSKAKLIAQTGGIIDENFLNMTTGQRLEKTRQEVLDNYRKTGKLQSGQHIQDQKWYISSLIKRLNFGNLDPSELVSMVGGLQSFGIDVNPSEFSSIDKTEAIAKLNQIYSNLETELKTNFPFNYKCMTFHDYVANNLIKKQKIGNNQVEDQAYSKLMMSSFMLDISKTKKKESNAFLNNQKPFKDSIKVIFETSTFKAIKNALNETLEQNLAGGDDKNITSLRGMATLSGMTPPITNEDVLSCLGINLPKDYWNSPNMSAGILDSCTPTQIITKIVGGLTNSTARASTRQIEKQLSDRDLEILKSGQHQHGMPVISSFSEKELVYLKLHNSKISDSTAKEILTEKMRQGFSLRLEIPDFDYTRILNDLGFVGDKIKLLKDEIIQEIVNSLPETKNQTANAEKAFADNEISLGEKVDENLKSLSAIEEQINSIEAAFDKNETIIQAFAYFKLREKKLSAVESQNENGELIRRLKEVTAINSYDIDDELAKLAGVLKDMKKVEPQIYNLIYKILDMKAKFVELTSKKKSIVEKISKEELETEMAALKAENQRELTDEEKDRLSKYEKLLSLKNKACEQKSLSENDNQNKRGE